MLALDPGCSAGATSIRIQELAAACFRGSPYRALHSLCCDYVGGALVLRGSLPSYFLKQIAQEAVAGLEGVQRIENRIQVVPAVKRPARC
jgi:hypothetical protein